MKSLEIVNLRVERLNNKPEMELVKNDEMVMISNNDMGYAGILTLTQLETIKQDLEVLEILRKKLVDVDFLKNGLRAFSPEKVLDYYNNTCLSSRELTRREYLKVKQWLEENE